MRAACLSPRPIRSILTFAALVGVLAGASVMGCGSSQTSGGATEGSGASASTSGDGPCNLSATENSEFCASEAVTPDCSLISNQTEDVCGVALPVPTGPIVRSTSTSEFHGSGPPQVSCFEKGHYPPKPGAPGAAKIKGHVKIFSSGCNSHDVQIQIYKVTRGGGADDGNLGDLVGQAALTGAAATCVSDGLTVSNADCGSNQRFECAFEYDNVPTNTELVIKTSSAPGHQDWAPLYEYNNYVTAEDLEAGVWNHDVRALAIDDYSVIPRAAIGQPISAGNGAIAGEVHDCGDVRVSGAVAAINIHSQGIFYFTSDEAAPLPDLAATSTSVLGLYTALDIAPGPIVVAALGVVENKPVTLGYFRARIFADSVTAVTFKGLQPFQVP